MADMNNGLICKGESHWPYNPKLKDRSRRLRNEMTPAERKLWFEYLRNHPVAFARQKPLNQYIVDFYCSTAKLVIEVDGDSHATKSGLAHDSERTAKLESYGLKVMRIANREVMENFESVCDKIDEAVKGES